MLAIFNQNAFEKERKSIKNAPFFVRGGQPLKKMDQPGLQDGKIRENGGSSDPPGSQRESRTWSKIVTMVSLRAF